jgi:hypothetical protein
MGKPTGFLDYEREDARAESPKERIKHFNEFHIPLSRFTKTAFVTSPFLFILNSLTVVW